MSDNKNMRIWEALGKTDPKHTKQFTRGGGFKGTAIKPMYGYQKMTEQFGPAGMGWGPDEPRFEVVPAGEEILVYCWVSLWYKEGDATARVYGVGGDKVFIKQKEGLRSSDEAFKAAYTDAIGNAMKLAGMAADVHMGLFDDSKYVREVAEEFAGTKPAASSDPKIKLITSVQAKAFRDALTKNRKEPIAAEVVKKALSEAGIKSSAEIPADKFQDWMDWAAGQ